MATLFAANGGAIIAMLGSTQHARLDELGWFGVGLLLSISMGVLTSFWSMFGINRIMKLRTSIEQSLLTGVPDQAALEEFLARSKLNWKTWVPSYVGFLSFACLAIGMLAIACHL